MIVVEVIVLALFGKSLGLGTSCTSNTECFAEEQCISGTCQCGTGQIFYNGRCVTNSGICTGAQQVYFNGNCLSTKKVNEPCETSNQCLGGSACFNSVCVCPTGTTNDNGICREHNGICQNNQIYIQGQCYNLATIGQSCQIASQCIGGATCLNNQCQCPFGTTLVGTMSGFNTNSADEPHCEPIAQCQNSSLTCPVEQVLVSGICRNRVQPGQRCYSSAQCYDAAECSSNTQQCVCPVGMFLLDKYCRKLSSDDPCDQVTSVLYNENCFNVQKPGGNCLTNLQCLGGSECISGYCQCPTDMQLINEYCVYTSTTCNSNEVMVNNRCFDMVSLGENCEVSEQCRGNAECSYLAVCSCPKGMMESNGNCITSSDLLCSNNQVQVNGACYPRVAPSSRCFYDEQCLDGSNCIANICMCPTNTRLIQNYCVSSYYGTCAQSQVNVNGRCLDLRQPGQSCISNLQCLGASTCPSGTCVCSNGYENIMNYCVLQVQTTQCANTQININGQCYNYVSINEYCIYDKQCLGDAKCQNNFCVCDVGYVWQNNMCVPNSERCAANQVYFNGICYNSAIIGERCIIEQQCEGGSSCISSYCQCPSGTYQSGSRCISATTGSTVCNANQVNIDGACYSIAYVGYACQYTQQCFGGSQCTNGYCQCPTGYIQQGINCVIQNSNVDNCPANQVYVNGYCYDYVSIGQTCQVTQQCQDGSACTGGYCLCPSGTYQHGNACIAVNDTVGNCSPNQIFVNGICYPYAAVGQNCQVMQQCRGGSLCNSGICHCPVGSIVYNSICINNGNGRCYSNQVYVNNQCMNLAEIGEMCYYNEQCLGYSECMLNSCSCPVGTAILNGFCEPISTSTANPSCTSYQVNVNGQCLNQVTIGMECSHTLQCTDSSSCLQTNSGSSAPMMTCQCNTGYVYNGSICTRINGVTCPYSTVYVNYNNCLPLAGLNQACIRTVQCMGHASCISQLCQCANDQFNISGLCV